MCTEQSFWGVYSTELWNAISSAFKRTWFWFQGKMVTSWLVSSRSNFNFLPHSLIVLCHFVSSSPQLVFVLFVWQDEAQRLAIYSIGLWQADEDLSTPEVGEIIYWASGLDICSEQPHLRTLSKEVNPARNMKSWFVSSGCLDYCDDGFRSFGTTSSFGAIRPLSYKVEKFGSLDFWLDHL